MRSALIVVDMQRDFMKGGTLAVEGGLELVPVVNKLIERARKEGAYIIATQDWHPDDHGSFASNNNTTPFTMGELGGLPQMFWPDHCVQWTDGAAFHPDLKVDAFDIVFQKGTDPTVDSYSGVKDNGGKNPTGLMQYLKDNHIGNVLVCGLALDYCVAATAIDIANEFIDTQDEINVGLILDATASVNPANDKATVVNLVTNNVYITSVSSFLEYVNSEPQSVGA